MVTLHPLALELVQPPWADEVVACPADAFDAADMDAFAARLAAARERDAFRAVDGPGFALYRLVGRGHELLGVVGDLHVGSGRRSRLRVHEQTDPAREAAVQRHRQRVGADTSPVMVGLPSHPRLDRLLADLADASPAVVATTGDGVRHEVWPLTEPDVVACVAAELALPERCYLLDGHHRVAAAVRQVGQARGGRQPPEGPAPGGASGGWEPQGREDPRDPRRVLAALFPLHQVCPLGYHRVVRRPPTARRHADGASPPRWVTAGLWEAVEARFAVEPAGDLAAAHPRNRGEMALRLDGVWARVTPRPGLVPAGLPDRLDEAVVQRHLLGAVLGVTGPRRDGAVSYVPGTVAPDELERVTSPQDVLVVLAAPPMADVQAVADVGAAFPPKSTYFAPKPAVGLLLGRRGAPLLREAPASLGRPLH